MRSAAFSPDGLSIVTTSSDHSLRLWRLESEAREAGECEGAKNRDQIQSKSELERVSMLPALPMVAG